MKTHKEPKKKDYKDSEVNKLRKRINKLIKENNELKSQVNTLQEAFKRTGKYIDDKLDGVPIENIIKGVEKEKKMDKIIKDSTCPDCGSVNMYNISGQYGDLTGCRECTYTKIKR